MRVTKTVREYIEKQVRLKIEPKYAAQKELEESQQDVLNNMFDSAITAAKKAFNEVVNEVIAKNTFLCDERKDEDLHLSYSSRCVTIPSFGNWRTKMNKEIKETVDNIIVNLELGGTKADLDHMLAEL